MSAAKESVESHLLKIKAEAIRKLPSLERSPIWDTLTQITQTANPEPTEDIDYVFILSARATYLGTPVDNQKIPDTSDDYNRVRLGIELAKKITALRLKKDIKDITKRDLQLFGPNIIYNGRDLHNQELVKSMAMNPTMARNYKEYNEFSAKNLLNDYPAEKLCILDLPPKDQNTKGQFICVRDKLKIKNTSVALVTHAYHFPRVNLMVGKGAPLNPFGENVKCYAVLVDRLFQAPGAAEDIAGELQRIPQYTAKGDLCAKDPAAITYKRTTSETAAASAATVVAVATTTVVHSATGSRGAAAAASTAATTTGAAAASIHSGAGSTGAKTAAASAATLDAKSNAEKEKTGAVAKSKNIATETLEDLWLYKLHVANKVHKPGVTVSLDELELSKIDKARRKILRETLW